jgi:beta-glucosidase
MSDWVSTYSAAGAANGGLDLEMPTALWLNNEKLLPEVKAGKVSKAVIDDKVRRLLRLAVCFGWIDNEQVDDTIPMDDPETARVSLEAARASIVLLKNDGILPFDRSKIKKIAVVGPNAHPAVICGGGSAWNQPNHQVSVLDGIRAYVGDRVEVLHATGPVSSREWRAFSSCDLVTFDGQKGLAAEYFNSKDLSGDPVKRCVDKQVNFWWGSGAPVDGITVEHWSVRWVGSVMPERDGTYAFYASSGDSGYRIWANHQLIIDTWDNEKGSTQKAELVLQGGKACDITIEYRKTRHWAHMHFGWEDASNAGRETADALKVVAAADAVVVVTGFDNRNESEGSDRTFAMQPELDRFVMEAARCNPNTVVVLLSGGNVDMNNWIDNVKGLLHAWYPGQEGGTAVAEVLFGSVNPSAKLPATFESRLEDRSSFDCYQDADNDKRVTLTDGIFCGYRHADANKVEPRFPFGFGLSYTSFAYRNLKLSATRMSASGRIKVSFDVANTGKHAGAEVAQLYVRDLKCSLPRPVKELKGFAKVMLQPGEEKRVCLSIGREALAFYDPQAHAWVTEPGNFEVLVGASSRHIKLKARFSLAGAAEGKKVKAKRKVRKAKG